MTYFEYRVTVMRDSGHRKQYGEPGTLKHADDLAAVTPAELRPRIEVRAVGDWTADERHPQRFQSSWSHAAEVDNRDPHCVANWPEAEAGTYDPRCCRFPKSCSA